MVRVRRYSCGIMALLVGICAALWAGDAAKVFNDLYREDVRRVAATSSPSDDAELAARMLASARAAANQPGLVKVLCHKACRLAMRTPRSYPTAAAAMELLVRSVPGEALAGRETLVEVRERQFAASAPRDRESAAEDLIAALVPLADLKEARGDHAGAIEHLARAEYLARALHLRSEGDVQARRKALIATQRLLKRRDGLRAELEADPASLHHRSQLILLHLIEMDDPAGAAEYLTAECDEMLRTFIPLAARDAGDLPARARLDLARWYETLVEQAPAPAKPAMLRRAETCYQSYVNEARPGGPPPAQVEIALRKLRRRLRRMEAADPQAANGTAASGPADTLPDRVKKAVSSGIAFLWSQQRKDGSWAGLPKFPVGPTALAAAALLANGVSPADRRMADALAWLEKHDTPKTHSLAYRCLAWSLAEGKYTRGKYRGLLRRDVGRLVLATRDGSYVYDCAPAGAAGRAGGDNCNSVHAVLGVRAGSDLGIPKGYWAAVARHWLQCQNADGGWAYRADAKNAGPTTASMTAAGVTVLALCREELFPEFSRNHRADRELVDRRIAKGLERLAVLFEDGLSGKAPVGQGDLHYCLVAVKRAAQACGEETLGAAQWYRRGAEKLIAAQKPDGSWQGRLGPQVATAFSLLFLTPPAEPLVACARHH